jgi:HAE1 family hydrophobic/amphiphilic exporter-1
VTLKQGTNVNNAQRDAERKVSTWRAALPEDADDPVVARFSTDEIPILRLSVNSDLSPGDLYQLLDDRVAPILSNVPGVGSVSLDRRAAARGAGGDGQRQVEGLRHQCARKSHKQWCGNSSTFPAGNVEGGARDFPSTWTPAP